MHIYSSESSVTYPGFTLWGPPPGITIALLTSKSDTGLLLNSRYEPTESPIKDPSMHPKQLFSYVWVLMKVSPFILTVALLIIYGYLILLPGWFPSILGELPFESIDLTNIYYFIFPVLFLLPCD